MKVKICVSSIYGNIIRSDEIRPKGHRNEKNGRSASAS